MFLYFRKHYEIIRKEKEEGTKLLTEIAVLIIFFVAHGTLQNETKRNELVLCETVLCEMVLCEMILCETVLCEMVYFCSLYQFNSYKND